MSLPEPSATHSSSNNQAPSCDSTGFTDKQLEFVKEQQSRFDVFYATAAACKFGAQKEWVCKNVMGEYQQKVRDADIDPAASLVVRLHRYLLPTFF